MTTSSPDPATTEDEAARTLSQELADAALSASTCYFQFDDEWRLFNIAALKGVLSEAQEGLLGRSLADSFLATTAHDYAAAVALAQPVLEFAIHANPAVVVTDNAVIGG